MKRIVTIAVLHLTPVLLPSDIVDVSWRVQLALWDESGPVTVLGIQALQL